jgi:K+-transporting ATPase ATPase A chain
MGTAEWLEILALVIAVAVTAPLLGAYMAKVFGGGHAPGDRVFLPVERFFYRLMGVKQDREQSWQRYAISLIAFSLVGVVALFAIQRFQTVLPLNPDHQAQITPFMSFNNAASFTTNTDWQSYYPESTVSFFTQTVGFTFQNFMSAAVGLAVAVALIRGLARRRSATIGNFWVDITRATTRILLPVSFVLAVAFMSQGVIQNFNAQKVVTPIDQSLVAVPNADGVVPSVAVPGGPVASQEAIKEFGTNGGGFFNANSGHPFENPNGLTNFLQMYVAASIAFGLAFTFGRMVGDKRQGRALFAVMAIFWIVPMLGVVYFEQTGNPNLTTAGVEQARSGEQSGGNMEGKETRFGAVASAMHGSNSTSTTTGSVVASHDSFTPAGGGIVLFNILLGEYGPGGVGSGLYGLLVMALIAVFIAGLMVGRTPEYLGKKIRAPDVKLATIYVLFVPAAVLVLSSITVLLTAAVGAFGNTGPHGLTEALYAYASSGNGNGSAFPGITVTSDWYQLSLGMAILIGRYLLIIPVLAIAGGAARKQPTKETSGTFPTHGPLFVGLLVSVIVIVGALTYFPVMALGPVVEQLSL